MQPTKVAHILITSAIAVLFGVVITLSFYGSFPPMGWRNSVVFWILAVVCAIAGWVISRRIADEEVGMDRSQISPLAVSNWMLTGRAVAWAGAIFGGFYIGMAIYVLPKAGYLVAADNDVPGMVAAILGATAAAAAGLYLERSCMAPPPDAPYRQNAVGA